MRISFDSKLCIKNYYVDVVRNTGCPHSQNSIFLINELSFLKTANGSPAVKTWAYANRNLIFWGDYYSLVDSDWQSTWDWCSKFIVTVTLGIITVAGPRGRGYWPPPTHLTIRQYCPGLVLGLSSPQPDTRADLLLKQSWIFMNIFEY